MAHESFEDETIAAQVNENFVAIKVDREERPDIDAVYMDATVAMTGHGGWPMTVFLDHDARPFFAGTYFPPAPRHQMPSFPQVLHAIVDTWMTRRTEVEESSQRIVEALSKRQWDVGDAAVPTLEHLDAAAASLLNDFDDAHGGFGGAPKFPPSMVLDFLIGYQALPGAAHGEGAYRMVDRTLTAMARGGMYDQLGGGFARYSVDEQWTVPHFEKMLYDNAQLAGLYVDAFARTGQPAFRAVAEGVFTYVLRDMTDPDGPFFSAQDAETDAIEGKYYVWSGEEIDMLLGADAKLFRRLFGVVDEPEFEHGNVLYRAVPLEQSIVDTGQTARVAQMRQKLLATRIKRKPPLLDDKVLTSWNGLMIRSLADGGRVLKKPEYTRAATRAAEFLIAKLRDNSKGHLLRTYRQGKSKLHAYLVDYAFLAEGLLALHQATGDEKWLTEARKLTDEQISLYWDKTRHGFYFTSHNHEELLARTQNGFDSVLPSGNSTSVRNLVRLAKRTGDAKYRTYAQQTLEAFAPQMREHQQRGGMGMSHMALALAEFLAK